MRRFFSWPFPLALVWLLAPLFGAVIAASIEPVPPHDYWWHLAMGRVVAATGAVPASNLFLYTLDSGLPFFDQPWLGQLLMWLAFDAFGHAGGFWLRNVLLFASVAVLTTTALKRSDDDARVVGGLMFIAVMLAYPVLTVRTQMFAFLPFALVVWSSLGVAEGRLRRRWLLLVPLLTGLWANLHGSFVLGPALVGATAVGLLAEQLLENRRIRREDAVVWGSVTVATLIAPMVSPHGLGVYSYVFGLVVTSSVTSSVTEWLPPRATEASGALLLAAIVGSLGVLAVRRRSVRLYEGLLYAGTLYLSVSAMRGLFWWPAIMPVIVAPHLGGLLARYRSDQTETSTPSGVAHAVLVGGVVLLTLAVQPGLGRAALGDLLESGKTRRAGDGQYLLNHEHPIELVEKVRADGRGRVFHDQAVGGLLELGLTTGAQPEQVAFVDQRMEWIPEDVWERYFAISTASDWEEELTRWGVDTLLLSPESQWPLLQAALASGEWELVATGHAHVLLYRAGAPGSLDRAEHPAEQ